MFIEFGSHKFLTAVLLKEYDGMYILYILVRFYYSHKDNMTVFHEQQDFEHMF